MAKTTQATANIDVTSDTFQNWVNKTNELLYALQTEIVTANSTVANTGTTAQPRRARINGNFGANTLVAVNELRGGNIGDNQGGLLTITSNTLIGGNTTVNASFANCQANLFVNNAVLSINTFAISVVGNNATINITRDIALTANNIDITATTLDLLANTTITRVTVTGNSTFVGETHFSNNLAYFPIHIQQSVSNTNLGTNTTTDLVLFSFNRLTYASAKITVQAKSPAGNVQLSEIVLAHNGVTPYLTVYGTVVSPTNDELGDFSTIISGANVQLRFKQNSQNTAIKILANLIRS